MLAAHTIERRRSARHLPAFVTYCRVLNGNEGLVWNLSATGLGMLIGYPPEPEQPLPVELSNPVAALPLKARVAHVRRLDAGDYFVGLRFDRTMESHELEPFVGPGVLAVAC